MVEDSPGADGPPALKVSVVVPVYNGADYLERGAPSLLEQSIGSDAYEVIYVNDGSTDDSEARLRRLVERYPHARLVSQENSGWPGKPRNVGVTLARGEYVQFVDQDDELAPEALERLYAMAARNSSDIVLGKLGGAMARPNPVFRRSVESASLADIPAIESLTGHKMFRRAFLTANAITFPEGYWRMEDLLFVIRAYAHNPRLSVVADYTCYLWRARSDGGNYSVAAFDVADHYRRLRLIIQTLRDGTEPGPLQDRLLRRLYRLETLSRVMERYIFDETRTDWREAFPHLSAVARECFPPGVRRGLPAVQRLRGELVEAGEQEAAYELARRVATLVPKIERPVLAIGTDAVLRCRLVFTLAWPDKQPLVLVPDEASGGEGRRLLLDPRLTEGLPGVQPFDAGDPLVEAQAQLQLEDAERETWWYPDGELTPAIRVLPDGRRQVVCEGDLAIDPAVAADGHPLAPGRYAVWFTGQQLGVSRRRRLVAPKAVRGRPAEWTRSAHAPIVVRPDSSEPGGRLYLEVRDLHEWLAEQPSTPAAQRATSAAQDATPPGQAARPSPGGLARRALRRLRSSRGGDVPRR